ncbi:MAG: 6-phosphogluconolactonase [Acidimicrobiales bacterium]
MRRFTFDQLSVIALSRPGELAEKAALAIDQELAKAVKERGDANVAFATGDTQVPVLDALVSIAAPPRFADWSKVQIFHLDEFVGIDIKHPASFARFVKERLVDRLAASSSRMFYINGSADPEEECLWYSNLLAACPLDLCVVGVGDNCHIAFNEPGSITDAEYVDLLARGSADSVPESEGKRQMETGGTEGDSVGENRGKQRVGEGARLVKVVRLEEHTRLHQLQTGGFTSIDDVPQQAITLSMPAILSARRIIAICSGMRKASAVKRMLEGEVSPSCPGSLLRLHGNATLLLDGEAASLLRHKPGLGRRAGSESR